MERELRASIREGIIIPLDGPSGQLKSTSPGLYQLPYFVYTGCRCRRGVYSTPAETLFYTGIPAEEGASVEEGAGVDDVSLVYTGTPGVDDKVLV